MKRTARLSFIIYSLSLTFAFADIPLTSLCPAGYFDDAAVVQSCLVNLEDTDAVYSAPLSLDTGGSVLRVAVDLALSPSNAVACAFGAPGHPFLRIICEDGRFSVLTGGETRPFGRQLPSPLTGTRACNHTRRPRQPAHRRGAGAAAAGEGARAAAAGAEPAILGAGQGGRRRGI